MLSGSTVWAVVYVHSSMYIVITTFTCHRMECYGSYACHFAQMVAMLHCPCSVCKACFKTHYCMVAQGQSIANFNCLQCAQPDLAATDIDKDDYLMLFSALLKEHLPFEEYQLFQKKATEFSLLKDPNFRWCAHVSVCMLCAYQ